MKTGYIKLHRSLKDWSWYKDISAQVVFIRLLLDACFEDTIIRDIEVKRGEALIYPLQLSYDLNLTFGKIRRTLKKLESTNDISIRKVKRKITDKHVYYVIAIKNWDKYQGIEDTEDTEVDEGIEDKNIKVKKQRKKKENTPNTIDDLIDVSLCENNIDAINQLFSRNENLSIEDFKTFLANIPFKFKSIPGNISADLTSFYNHLLEKLYIQAGAINVNKNVLFYFLKEASLDVTEDTIIITKAIGEFLINTCFVNNCKNSIKTLKGSRAYATNFKTWYLKEKLQLSDEDIENRIIEYKQKKEEKQEQEKEKEKEIIQQDNTGGFFGKYIREGIELKKQQEQQEQE